MQKTIKINPDKCRVFGYINNIPNIPTTIKKKIDMGLQKKERRVNLFYNYGSFFVQVDNTVYFKIKTVKKMLILDLKIGLQYLFNHNGLDRLNKLCLLENCSLKDSHQCTMKLLKAIS